VLQATRTSERDIPSLATSSTARTWAGVVYQIIEAARAANAGSVGACHTTLSSPTLYTLTRDALFEFEHDGRGLVEFLMVRTPGCVTVAVHTVALRSMAKPSVLVIRSGWLV
jgi:hypothetical protein